MRITTTVRWPNSGAGSTSYHGHVDEEVFEERPHVVGGVNLLHLHLRVDVTVVQEIHVRILHLEPKKQQLNKALEKFDKSLIFENKMST